MARVSNSILTPEEEPIFYDSAKISDRITNPSIQSKASLMSRTKKKNTVLRSLLREISAEWSGLTESEKDDWRDSAVESGINCWQLFIQDYCARRKVLIGGVGEPTLKYQNWIGEFKLTGSANEIELKQTHPRNYYVKQLVYGKKNSFQPVLVTEEIALPLEILINYKSNLTADGPDPFARFYARVWYSYQGRDLYNYLTIDMDLVSDWATLSETLSVLQTIVVRYDLFLHLHDVQGELYFDNLEANHSGNNWVRDPHCKNIEAGFTRNFYQVPKHWEALTLPVGASYNTTYKEFT